MKRKTRSILEEITNMVPTASDKSAVIESRAVHIIGAAINLLNVIRESYGPEKAGELERRFLNSIRGQDENKFVRGIRKSNEDK